MTLRLPDGIAFDRAVIARVPDTGTYRALDGIAVTLSKIGEVSGVWFALTVIAFVTDRIPARQAIWAVAAITFEWVLTNRIVKHQLHRDRPTPTRPDPKGVRRPTSSSFPSGHSSASACSAVLLSTLTGWWIPLVALALAIGWSRLHLRVHYPSDVLAGWLWGAALGGIAAALIV